jgi:hypothetical protein
MAPLRIASLTCALVSVTATAEGQDTAAGGRISGPFRVEFAPFLSVGADDASSTGAAIRFPVGARLSLEVETEWSLRSVSGLNAAGNLVVDLPKMARVTPYAIGGAGIERYTVTYDLPGIGWTTNLTSALALNAGGGIRVPITRRWGMRTDARVINGLGRSRLRWRIFYGAVLDVGAS